MPSPGDPIRKMVSPAAKCRIRARPTIASRSSAIKPRKRTQSASCRRASSKEFLESGVIETFLGFYRGICEWKDGRIRRLTAFFN